jgi:PAS domain S-box-containing protein
MLKMLDEDIARIDISDVTPLKVAGSLRWTGKAKFPGTPRPRSIVVFHLGDEMVAMSAFCPHEQADLSEGRFVEPFVLECPLHQNTYDLRAGAIKTFRVDMDGERMFLLWKRGTNELVAPTFNHVKVGQRSEEERQKTLELELSALQAAAKAREAHVAETLRQMEGMIREVEEKKSAVEASHTELTKMNEFVKRVTNTMSEVLVVLDTKGQVREVNERFTGLLGYARNETEGASLASFVAASEGCDDFDVGLFTAQRDTELEACFVAKDGRRMEHLLRIAPLYGANGKREGAVVVGTDIHAVKAAQREVNAAFGRVANLLDNMRQAVFVVLANGEIIDPVSRFTAEVFGEGVVGRNVFDVLYGEIPRGSEQWSGIETVFLATFGSEDFQWDLMADLLPRRIVRTKQRRDGDEVTILKVDYCPLRDAQGLMDKLMVVVEDVTKIEHLEQEKRIGERRTQILEELAKNRPEDLRTFLASAYEQLRESREMLTRPDNDSQTVMFRQLHTLKGNARVLGLTLIAQATHEAENVASALRSSTSEDTHIAEKVRDGISLVQRQVAEYSEVAERILHIPNELEEKALAELHRTTTELDAEMAHCMTCVGNARLARSVGRNVTRFAAACRAAADACGAEEVSHAAKAIEQIASGCASGARLPDPAFVKEVHASHGVLVESVIARRMRSHTGNHYSLATSSWTSLYLDIFALTQATAGAAFDAHGTLVLDRAAERALSSAGTLHAEYVTALLGMVPSAVRSQHPKDAVEALLRELWRHLALHALLESLALMRSDERAVLVDALMSEAEGDAQLVQVLESGRVRTGTLVGFLGARRRQGSSAHVVLTTLARLFGFADGKRVAQMFVSDKQPENVSAMLGSVDARTNGAGFDRWGAEIGATFSLFPPSPKQGLTYLKRLDVLRLATAFKELTAGNFQLLFDRVQTVEVMSFHFTQLQRTLADFKRDRSEASLTALEDTIGKLLDVPVIPSLHKYYATVTEVAARLNKRVNLQVTGDATVALPRDILYPLHDALVHLIRNAIDHGIELPDERRAVDKAETGSIDIVCREESGKFMLEIRDDGRGIDPVRLKQKARDLSLITTEAAASMSDQEALELIFRPHLSTAGNVTDISGRGIGMDVVRESLLRIGAILKLDSQVGRGTTFSITLAQKR